MKMKITSKNLGILFAALLAVGLVSATLITYYGKVTTTVDVNRAVVLTGDDCVDNACTESLTMAGGETVVTNEYTAESQTSVDGQVEVDAVPSDVCLTANTNYKLHAEGTNPREQRVRIEASDAGLTDLDNLTSIAFTQDVQAGYIGHVDVIVETSTGTDALVFEYAKVDESDCDDAADYPSGVVNTFGDKGIVDADANAWLSSGAAGPCGGAGFIDGNLAAWKAGTVDASVSGSSAIVALEFEVDSWIETSTSVFSDLTVNGVEVEVITLQAGLSNMFYLDIIADWACEAGTYSVVTELQVV